MGPYFCFREHDLCTSATIWHTLNQGNEIFNVNIKLTQLHSCIYLELSEVRSLHEIIHVTHQTKYLFKLFYTTSYWRSEQFAG